MGQMFSKNGDPPIIDRNRVSVAVGQYGTQGLTTSSMDPSLYSVLKTGDCMLQSVQCVRDVGSQDKGSIGAVMH